MEHVEPADRLYGKKKEWLQQNPIELDETRAGLESIKRTQE